MRVELGREGLRRPRAAPSGGSRAAGASGFTLIELAIAISVLLIAMVSVLSATSRMHSLRKQNRERVLAQNATRSVAERVHARSHELSADPERWAARLLATFGPGGEPGDGFDVSGLAELPERPSPGTITIVTDETVTGADLGVEIGMPRDLNGDGDADDRDVTVDARLLPVLFEVRWRGPAGESSYRHAMFVMGY